MAQIILDGLPADILIKHPRNTSRVYQFQVTDPVSSIPLNLATQVTNIKAMIKFSPEDDDSQALLTKQLLGGAGIALSAGPGSNIATNGWFDLTILDVDITNARTWPNLAQFSLGIKIYPQKQEVLQGIFEIHGETVWA